MDLDTLIEPVLQQGQAEEKHEITERITDNHGGGIAMTGNRGVQL